MSLVLLIKSFAFSDRREQMIFFLFILKSGFTLAIMILHFCQKAYTKNLFLDLLDSLSFDTDNCSNICFWPFYATKIYYKSYQGLLVSHSHRQWSEHPSNEWKPPQCSKSFFGSKGLYLNFLVHYLYVWCQSYNWHEMLKNHHL